MCAIVATCLLIGCSSSPLVPAERPPFQLTLPAVRDLPPLPVRLIDHSGTIKGVETPFRAPDRPAGVDVDTFVVAVVGRPEAVFVVWLGGLCDEQVDLEYTGGDATFTVQTSSGQRGCRLAGIARSIVVVFGAPIDVSRFIVQDMS